MLKGLFVTLGAASIAIAGPAVAAESVAADAVTTLAPNTFVWQDDASIEPVSIVISINDQRAYVYRGETMIAVSSVSTGKDGNDTPTGTFPILQKATTHRSNLYASAPMPFMQRLTWDGVAIHAGRNPGFPASHGCIRVPTAFARKLFAATNVGTQVIVTEGSQRYGFMVPGIAYPAIEVDTALANQF